MEAEKGKIREAFTLLNQIYRKYIELDESYYNIVVCWLLGIFFYSNFVSYPYLFLNAMKGSGKSRFLKLSSFLIDGTHTVSLTEAVLFRENDPLFIDEAEDMSKKEKRDLRELLNAAYKKGLFVKRASRKNPRTGQIYIEKFHVYRPISLANIDGLDDVLEDRCITILLERSNNREITRRVEMFEQDELIKAFKSNSMSFLSFMSPISSLYAKVCTECNKIGNNVSNSNKGNEGNNDNNVNYIMDKIDKSILTGRDLELWLPLFIIGCTISKEVFDQLVFQAEEMSKERQETNLIENRDYLLTSFLLSFISGKEEKEYIPLSEMVKKYKGIEPDDDWFDSRWLGRALKRNRFAKHKERTTVGRVAMLNFERIQQKANKLGIKPLETPLSAEPEKDKPDWKDHLKGA